MSCPSHICSSNPIVLTASLFSALNAQKKKQRKQGDNGQKEDEKEDEKEDAMDVGSPAKDIIVECVRDEEQIG